MHTSKTIRKVFYIIAAYFELWLVYLNFQQSHPPPIPEYHLYIGRMCGQVLNKLIQNTLFYCRLG